jgi:Ala-tRNA(Pro) deacylase
MTNDSNSGVFETLNKLLQDSNARFRVIAHAAEGSSAKVAEIRGTAPGQGAKAMLCRAKDLPEKFLLAVLPGDRKLDFKKLALAAGARKASLAAAAEATALTCCVMGSVPPFALWPEVSLIVDPKLLEHAEIAFNAGRLDRSMLLNAEDYRRIAAPLLADISAQDS